MLARRRQFADHFASNNVVIKATELFDEYGNSAHPNGNA
jgi:hypothetical protein